jgi:hypothetical protein
MTSEVGGFGEAFDRERALWRVRQNMGCEALCAAGINFPREVAEMGQRLKQAWKDAEFTLVVTWDWWSRALPPHTIINGQKTRAEWS